MRSVVPAAASATIVEASLSATVWRANAIGSMPAAAVCSSGWPALDRELPGGGWPRRSLTELLAIQPAVLEWRLLAPVLRDIAAKGGCVVLVGPTHHPHSPGIAQCGIPPSRLVWVAAHTPAERLWCVEQVLKAQAIGALLAWLPQARPEQIRRLQIRAQGCDAPLFLFRPQPAASEPSAAPLRIETRLDAHWALHLKLLKRRGPPLDKPLVLPAIPPALDPILAERRRRMPLPGLRHPAPEERHVDAVGCTVPARRSRRHALL